MSRFLALVAAFALVLPLLVARPAVAQEFTPDHIAAARAAIAATRATREFDTLLPSLADDAKALFARSNPSIIATIEEVVTNVALDVAKRRPELDREIERIWAARFTEEELKEITAFYNSPVGQKFGDSMPLMINESVAAAKTWGSVVSTELVAKSREEFLKLGHQF